MKNFAVLLVAVAFAVAMPALDSRAEEATGVVTLNGEYVWNYQKEKPGPLEAIFTPSGEGTWDVAFHFEFSGKPHTYSGTAQGVIGEGKLEGKVQNEEKERTFTFAGSFEDGTFKGTHSEVNSNGSAFETGTLSLE